MEVSFTTPLGSRRATASRRDPAQRHARPPGGRRQRFFTFKVRPPLKVLIVADHDTDAEFVAAALDPDLAVEPQVVPGQGSAPPTSAASTRRARRLIACVFLLNVEQLEEADWGALNGYVHEGGGLVVGLGNALHRRELQRRDRQPSSCRPSSSDRKTPSPEMTFGKVTDVTHPLFQRYGKEFDSQLAQMPVYRYWAVKPPQAVEGARRS